MPRPSRWIFFLGAVAFVCLIRCKRNDENPHEHTSASSATESRSTIPACKEDARVYFIRGMHDTLVSIPVELATTETERNLGLMYRDQLADSCGMLFIFEQQKPLSFWMKNTVLALDMFFVTSSGRVATIHEFTRPFDEGAYPSSEPCQFVLETTAGFRARHHLAVGNQLRYVVKK